MFSEVLATPSTFRPCLALFTAALILSPAASAFQSPLSDEALREAYFLGQRHDEKVAQFFETYRHYLHAPASGPDVHMIELLTPYALAVDFSRKHGAPYSAQQAQRDYREHGNSLQLAVHVRYTPAYGAGFPYSSAQVPGKSGTWKDFQIRLVQNGNTIESRSLRYEGTRIGGGGKGGGAARSTGFIAWLEYDAQNITSTDATVEVTTPDGQHLVVTFDLDKLR